MVKVLMKNQLMIATSNCIRVEMSGMLPQETFHATFSKSNRSCVDSVHLVLLRFSSHYLSYNSLHPDLANLDKYHLLPAFTSSTTNSLSKMKRILWSEPKVISPSLFRLHKHRFNWTFEQIGHLSKDAGLSDVGLSRREGRPNPLVDRRQPQQPCEARVSQVRTFTYIARLASPKWFLF